MGFDVKITTFPHMLNVLLPYHCRGCGRIGEPLCECCKKNTGGAMRIFKGDAQDDLKEVYAVGKREGVLKKLVVGYKYQSRCGFAPVLAELVAKAISPELKNAVIVPLPTIDRHIRQRGFDHTLKLAKELARITGFKYVPLLRRINDTVQVGTDEETRKKQAEEAYEFNNDLFASHRLIPSPRVSRATARAAALRTTQKASSLNSFATAQKDFSLNSYAPILLLDDIWTTGASMKAGARKIREAGFADVYGVVIATGLIGDDGDDSAEKLVTEARDGADDKADDGVGQKADD